MGMSGVGYLSEQYRIVRVSLCGPRHVLRGIYSPDPVSYFHFCLWEANVHLVAGQIDAVLFLEERGIR